METLQEDKLILVSPSECINWEFHDRGAFELNIDELAEQIKEKGQTQPIIVRSTSKRYNDNNIKYEVIDGERRLAAMTLLSKKDPEIKIKAIIRELDTTDAFETQLIANQQNPLSGYSRAKGYQRFLETTGKDQSELAKIEGIDKSNITRRLCYVYIDDEFWNAISNPAKISVSMAHSLFIILNKAKKISDAFRKEILADIISVANQIENGDGGDAVRQLKRKVENKILGVTKDKKKIKTERITNAGRGVYTISPDGEIKINKSIFKKILPNFDEFNKELVGLIELYAMQELNEENSIDEPCL